MIMSKIYVVKGKAKCNIRHNGIEYHPGSHFYSELNENECEFLSRFLESVSVEEKEIIYKSEKFERGEERNSNDSVSGSQTRKRTTKQ